MKPTKFNFEVKSKSITAFSLIEMLTVLVIIGILAGLILPAIQIVRTAGKKAATRSTVNQLSLALRSYYEEYGTWPSEGGTIPATKLTEKQRQGLYLLLSGSNCTLDAATAGGNVRSIRFMEFKASDLRKDKTMTYTNFCDPWKHPYEICFDGSGDGNASDVYGEGLTVPHNFAIWSWGPDGITSSVNEKDPNNPKVKSNIDNVTSWN